MKFTATKQKTMADNCKFCKAPINLDNEGVTYADGKCAHEHCDDSNEFNKANESDLRD